MNNEITEPQLKYILSLFQKLNWSQEYGMDQYHLWYGDRIASLTDLTKTEASLFIDSMKARL